MWGLGHVGPGPCAVATRESPRLALGVPSLATKGAAEARGVAYMSSLEAAVVGSIAFLTLRSIT